MSTALRSHALGAVLYLATLPACTSDQPGRPSVLLITIDTLRPDRLGCYGYDGIETPQIDALAARGVKFTQAISPIPITLPSHASIFTGPYLFEQGVRENGSFELDGSEDTLAEMLRRHARFSQR